MGTQKKSLEEQVQINKVTQYALKQTMQTIKRFVEYLETSSFSSQDSPRKDLFSEPLPEKECRLLKVSQHASEREIGVAWKFFALRFHDDKVRSLDDELKEKVSKYFKKVKLAYDTLKTIKKRQEVVVIEE